MCVKIKCVRLTQVAHLGKTKRAVTKQTASRDGRLRHDGLMVARNKVSLRVNCQAYAPPFALGHF